MSSRRWLVPVLAALVLPALPAAAVEIELVVADGPGSGFNSTKSVAAVSGNEATTLGEQRRNAFEAAASFWGSRLLGDVTVRVEASWKNLSCSAISGTLASAGPTFVFRDFPGAPRPGTWYVKAQASNLAELELDPTVVDAEVSINDAVGTGGCLTTLAWDYRIDQEPAGPFQVDFFDTMVHELAHALGFLTVVDIESGAKLAGFDDTFMVNLADLTTALTWDEMTNGQRSSSATGSLFWVGGNALVESQILESGTDSLTGFVDMHSPATLEQGSSVSHFAETLGDKFDELMEPAATPNQDAIVTLQVMQDIGWAVDHSVARSIPDIDGNGVAELAVLHTEFEKGSTVLSVLDGLTMELIERTRLSATYAPLDLEPISHFSGTGADELVFLTLRPGDGLVDAGVMDGESGEELTPIPVNGVAVLPLGVEVVPSFGGSSADEVAVLAMKRDVLAARLFIYDGSTAALLTQVSYLPGVLPVDFAVVRSVGGTDAADVAVLLRSPSSGQRILSVVDGRSGAEINQLPLPPAVEPVLIATVDDFAGTGADELAVVSVSSGGGGAVLDVLDASSGATVSSMNLDATLLPAGLTVIRDLGDGPAPEVVVWGRRNASGKVRIFVRDADSGNLITALTPAGQQQIRDVTPIPDMGATPADELGLLTYGLDSGKLEVLVNDALDGSRISAVNANAKLVVGIGGGGEGGPEGDAGPGEAGPDGSSWEIHWRPDRPERPVVE